MLVILSEHRDVCEDQELLESERRERIRVDMLSELPEFLLLSISVVSIAYFIGCSMVKHQVFNVYCILFYAAQKYNIVVHLKEDGITLSFVCIIYIVI